MHNLVWYIFFAGLAAHASLVGLHFTRMWNAEHFQFFPVALVAAGVLAYSRRGDIVRNATLPRASVVWAGMAIIIVVYFFAMLLGLALTGWICFLGFLATMIYASYGRGGLWASLPIFLMLGIIKPLPSFFEQPLTIGMQKIASLFAGCLLNMMGVMHFQQGVVLVLVGKSFMAEEACSGIRSLFSSLAAVIFLGLMNRYHWGRHLLNVMQTILWVIVFNAFRIAMVVFVEENYDFSIAEGWVHEMFGYLIFFVIFGTVLSTDRLFAAIKLPPSTEPTEDPPNMPQRWRDALAWPGSKTSGILLAAVFGVLAFLSFRMLFLVPDYKEGFAQRLPSVDRDQLPAEIAGWKVNDYRHVDRAEHDLQGAESYIWELKKDGKRILVSVDGTFNEFHDLAWCYGALGWDCTSNRFYSSIAERASGVQLPDGELTRLDLKKLSGETGIVMFSALDRKGEVVVPPPQFGQETGVFLQENLINAMRFAVGMQTREGLRATTFVPPVSTVQLVYMPTEPVNEDELEEIKKIFLYSRETLKRAPRFVGN